MKFIIYTFVLLGVTACVSPVNITPQPTGGSKADGIVTLSYEYTMFQQPVIDEAKATQTALQRCQSWGYSSAEKFSGARRQCLQFDPTLGCVHHSVSINYQCQGN
ncbi:YecR family lipoprotein [Neisseria sp. HMSC068C04]|uniref:YecR family lipoprotein n=1 Tax=Neisseria sp. HMSC068C04 TaxID=1715179 RepID=UPI0009F3214C|nr:YecR family lipoprotein [Neisseria sp. HMSC068C04]